MNDALRSVSQRNNWQMLPAAEELHFDLHGPCPATGRVHRGLRWRALRATRPPRSQLQAWLLASRNATGVDLVRRPNAKRAMRPMVVVPIHEMSNLSAHFHAPERDQDASRAVALQRSEESLDDGYGLRCQVHPMGMMRIDVSV